MDHWIFVVIFIQLILSDVAASEEEEGDYEFDDNQNSKIIPFGEPVKNKFEGGTAPINVPRGIFHYSMRESGLGSNFKVPDESLASPLEVGGKLRTKDSMVGILKNLHNFILTDLRLMVSIFQCQWE
uniref:Uncharacterized protein n=1 Tax=Panagrolaimus davidi TaxID=227884 RepID=A0A914PC46_9BILA